MANEQQYLQQYLSQDDPWTTQINFNTADPEYQEYPKYSEEYIRSLDKESNLNNSNPNSSPIELQQTTPLLHSIFKTLNVTLPTDDSNTTYSYGDDKTKHSDESIYRLILSKKDEINERDEDGNTPLMLACQTDMLGTFVMTLLENGANLFLRNNNGQNAIMAAASKNNYIYLFVMIYIVKKCESSDEIEYDIDKFIKTFLDFLKDKTEIKKKDGDVLAKFKDKLLIMSETKLNTVIEILEERIKNQTNSYRHLCGIKLNTYYSHANNFMPTPIDDADNEGNTAFMITALGSTWFLSEILIRMGCDINLRNLNGETALMIACKNNNLNFVEKLYRFLKGEQKLYTLDVGIQNNLKQNAHDLTTDEKIKKILTDEPYHSIILDPNFTVIKGDEKMGFLILESAIKYGKTDLVVSICSNYKINKLDTKDEKGNNVLMLACKHGNMEIVEMVISSFDIHVKHKRWNQNQIQKYFFTTNTDLKCCLHLATESGNLNIVKYLLELKYFDLEHLTQTDLKKIAYKTNTVPFKETFSEDDRFKDVMAPARFANIKFHPKKIMPMHLAAEFGYSDIAKCLFQNGSDAIGGTSDYMNPIHYAAKNGHIDIVNMLLQEGAKSYFKVGEETSLQMAQSEIKKLELLLTEFVSENDQTQKIKKQIEKLKEVECILELCELIRPSEKSQDQFESIKSDELQNLSEEFKKKYLSKRIVALEVSSTETQYNLIPYTFLCVACYNLRFDIAKFLITEGGANKEQKNLNDETLLEWATKSKKNIMRSFLLNVRGGSLNKTRKLFKKKTRKNKKPKRFQRKSFRKH